MKNDHVIPVYTSLWLRANCFICSNHEPSESESKAKCKLNYRLFLAKQTNTTIPIEYAQKIGCKTPANGNVKLNNKCLKFK